jgi:MFS family permease
MSSATTPTPFATPDPKETLADGRPNRPADWRNKLVNGALINRNFALLWSGQAVSSVGDTVFEIALVLWIGSFLAQGQSWAPIAVGGVILAAAVPQVVVGPIAGVFVDRWDKRETMMRMDALQAILVGLLVLIIGGIPVPFMAGVRLPTSWVLGAVFADVALVATCAQFYLPARYALIGDIVREPRRTRAISMSQSLDGLSVIFGPPLAAALVFGLGVQWALLLNALSFVVALMADSSIHAPQAARSVAPGQSGHFVREFTAGVRYVVSHNVLRTLLVAVTLTWLGFGALEALGYFFVTRNLHAAPSMYGFLGSAFGVGAIGGAVIVTLYGKRIGLPRVLWVCLVTCGVFVIVLAHLTTLGPALLAAALFGITATGIIVAVGPLILSSTAREFVGRVTDVINPAGRLAALISVSVAGSLVSTVLRDFHAKVFGVTFGPVNTVFTGMGLLAVAGGLYARANLRGMKPPPTGEESAT